ncbi:MAG: radical SAM protein [candidate division Zixibacteria bacterium]|nr:radical SAM protein [candidate division Zixibacteria bacterium]
MLKVNEIFHSIQGESTYSGWPCAFIRLSWCNLRCDYCDTVYAYQEGEDMSIAEIMEKIDSYDVKLAEITGGEPLLQSETPALAQRLIESGYKTLIETSGSIAINTLPDECIRIVDFKTPSCGMSEKNLWKNVDYLTKRDEVKFVVRTREDFDWALEQISKRELIEKCAVSVSPVFGELDNQVLAEWILESKLPLRLNLQIHKYIWDPQTRGV